MVQHEMGGKKKPSMKQMEKTTDKKDEKEKKGGKSEKGPMPERRAPGINAPDPKNEKIIGEIKKMKALTPYAVATRFNIRLSVAKDFLDELAQRGVIQYVSGARGLKIYKPAGD
jgi:small subunit ribosomal protein S25e